MISKSDVSPKNLADSMEAANASVRRPATPEEVSDQNTTRSVFNANEFAALMRGPDAPTKVPTPTQMQTVTMDTEMFKEMQELMFETKQQL
jgi:hypothetical protein